VVGGVAFPLRLVRDGFELTLTSREALELAVGRLDDWRHDYRCTDAVGRRLRLVVWQHTWLFAAPVDRGWHPGRLTVVEGDGPQGRVLAERSDGRLHRLVELEANGHHTPLPNWPQPLPRDAGLGLGPSRVDPRAFDRFWTLCTQARPHRRYRTGWWGRLGVGAGGHG
jgi:hypothetical protein